MTRVSFLLRQSTVLGSAWADFMIEAEFLCWTRHSKASITVFYTDWDIPLHSNEAAPGVQFAVHSAGMDGYASKSIQHHIQSLFYTNVIFTFCRPKR